MIPPEILLKEAQLVQSTKGTILSKTPLSASVLTTTPTRPAATPGTHGARSRVRLGSMLVAARRASSVRRVPFGFGLTRRIAHPHF